MIDCLLEMWFVYLAGNRMWEFLYIPGYEMLDFGKLK